MNWRALWRWLTSWIEPRGPAREPPLDRGRQETASTSEPGLPGIPPSEAAPRSDVAASTHADASRPGAVQEEEPEEVHREEQRGGGPPHVLRREALDLVIGLDFGTAATKVVVQSPFYAGGRAVAVSFGDLGHRSSPYLLPTRVWVEADGTFSLKPRGEGKWLTDLKLRLMDLEAANGTPGDLMERADRLAPVVGYLALVLSETQHRVLAMERDTWGRFHIRWALNVGIPSAGYNDAVTRKVFRRAARAAWELSQAGAAVSRERAADLLRRDGEAAADPVIEVVPEVAAQVVGYARSTLRDPGLHLLVDVGATTLDICGFVLHEAEGRDRYELLTTTVERLGALRLHQERLDALSCSPLMLADTLAPLPETMAEYHPGCACSRRDVDSEFRDRARGFVMRDLFLLKRSRDPLSRRWSSRLPAFLCGGGSGMRLYSQVLQDAAEELRRRTTAAGLVRRTLPKPTQLANDDLDESIFHRLSVAYGLSFDAPDIGEIAPPNEIPDIPVPRRPDAPDRFVSKDMV